MTISSKIGFGKKVMGEIAVLGRPGEILDTHHLDMRVEGKILVLLAWVSREFLEKASFVGAVGVVVPSLHFRDFEYFRQHGDFSLVIYDKFGKLDAPVEMVKKLSAIDGKKGELDGDGKFLQVD